MIMANCQLYDKYEVWRSIKGYEGRYCVSSRGRVKSVNRVYKNTKGEIRQVNGCILKFKTDNDGYYCVTLRNTGKKQTIKVSSLVAIAFLGEKPSGYECCHIDGNNKNNNVDNLRWDTHRNNILDKIKHGSIAKGEKHGMCTITEELARKIKVNIVTGKLSRKEFCKSNNVSCHIYDNIRNGRSWQHISKEGVSV